VVKLTKPHPFLAKAAAMVKQELTVLFFLAIIGKLTEHI
jgi:hypothetical protein